MRIVQVMPEFGLAGAEIMCESLIYELRSLNNEVYAISLFNYHSPITDRIERSGIEVFYLNKKPGLDVGVIKKLTSLLRQLNPDVVHTHRYVMKYVLPAARIANVRTIIHTVHNIAEKENFRRDRLFYHIGYKAFNVVPVALSNEIQESVANLYHLHQIKIPVIFNGVEITKYIKKQNYTVESEFRILHIGRFAKQKNHHGLINVFHKLCMKHDNLKLYLIGEGELEDDIRRKVNELGLSNKVVFVGLTDRISEYLYRSDLFVLPSLYEGMPMTLIEAMATGLPIVTTNVGGIPSMLTDHVDALLSNTEENSIYNCILQMIDNEELRSKLGENAYLRASDFSSACMAKKYMSVYQSAMGKHRVREEGKS